MEKDKRHEERRRRRRAHGVRSGADPPAARALWSIPVDHGARSRVTTAKGKMDGVKDFKGKEEDCLSRLWSMADG